MAKLQVKKLFFSSKKPARHRIPTTRTQSVGDGRGSACTTMRPSAVDLTVTPSLDESTEFFCGSLRVSLALSAAFRPDSKVSIVF